MAAFSRSLGAFTNNHRRRCRVEPLEDRRMLSVLFVDDDAGGGGDGLAWASAFDDLQAALDSASTLNADAEPGNDVDQIWIAKGVYKPSEEREPGDPRSASFSLSDGISLYGGFAGDEAAVEERDWLSHETILTGDLAVTGVTADNAYTVVYCGPGIEATLDGFVITGGNADGLENADYPERRNGGGAYNVGILSIVNSTISGNIVADHGGGLYSESTLTVRESIIEGNSTLTGSGGGVYTASGSTLTIEASTIRLNVARFHGGGISNDGSALVVDSLVTANSTGNDGDGAGIKNSLDSSLTVRGSTVSENISPDRGGGICNYSVLVIEESLIADNNGYNGGAIFNRYGESTIAGSTIHGNTARGDGGAIYNCTSGFVSISNSVINDNRALDDVGGIKNVNGTLNIDHSTISGNVGAEAAGGIVNNGSIATLVLMNSRVLANIGDAGGGVRNLEGGTATIINTIIADNSARIGGGVFNDATAGALQITNTTIINNVASDKGGGIWNQAGSSAMTIDNSIVAMNTSHAQGPDIIDPSGILAGCHNLVGDGSGQVSLVDGQDGNLVGAQQDPIDPQFFRVPSDGGDGWGDDPDTPDFDESTNDDYGDLRLQAESPAIDAGDNALAVDADGNTLAFDLSGKSRVVNQIVDMGALESRNPVALDDTFETIINSECSIPESALFVNDSHPDQLTFDIVAVVPSEEFPGMFSCDDGVITFSPEADYIGTAQFTYTVEDTEGAQCSATVTINVTPIPGDLNRDGIVSSRDLDIVRAWWGMEVAPGDLSEGDASGDGYVGSADLDTVRANWGNANPVPASASAVTGSDIDDADAGETIYGPVRKRDRVSGSPSHAAIQRRNAAETAWSLAVQALNTRGESEVSISTRRGVVAFVFEGWREY